MLGKMFIHGLVAAALIGSAAYAYAESKDAPLPAPQATVQPAAPAQAGATVTKPAADTGYLTDTSRDRKDRERAKKSERHHDKRHHDDDDD